MKYLYFSASWCGPCRALGPIMNQVSSEVPVQKVDVDSEYELAQKFNVRNIPTVVISSCLFKEQIPVVEKNEVWVLNLNVHLTISLRQKINHSFPISAQHMLWNIEDCCASLNSLGTSFSKETILNFENTLPFEYKSYFTQDRQRLYDRSLIINTNISGSMMRSLLKKYFSIPLNSLEIACFGLCHSDEKLNRSLLNGSLQANELRGLIGISSTLIQQNNFKNIFYKCCVEALSLQGLMDSQGLQSLEGQ